MTNKIEINRIKTAIDFEVYTSFINNEIELLKYVKTILTSRLELDRQYAKDMVKNINTKKRNYNLDGFITERCWITIEEQINATSQIIIKNCETFDKELIPKLENLIKEKNEAKKKLNDDKKKYDSNLNKLKTTLENTYNEYKKAFSRFNETIKILNDPLKKQNENLQKKQYDDMILAASNMYICHNNYIIALKEYNEQRFLLFGKIFPNLISSHKEIQENLLEEFKNILNGFYNHLNFARPEFQMVYNIIENTINSIEPFNDYNQKIIKNNPFSNTEALYSENIDFDLNLITITNDSITPPLKHNEISIVKPTVSILNEKKLIYQKNAHDFEREIRDIDMSLIRMRAENDTLTNKIKTINMTKEKFDCENQKNINQNIFNEIATYASIDNPPDIYQKTSILNCGYEKNLGIQNRRISGASNLFGSNNSLSKEQTFTNKILGVFNFKKKEKEIDHDLDLLDQPWFHGILNRQIVETDLLKTDGDFLVRESSNRQRDKNSLIATPYVLSMKCSGIQRYSHSVIYQNNMNSKYSIDESGNEFNKISELIEFYMNNREKVPNIDSSYQFIRPVPRENWEIDDSDLHNTKEIARGNFGVVYAGTYKNKKVAIKSLKFQTGTSNDEEKKKFLAEGRLLQKYEHKHIVRFTGIVINTDPIKIVMEFIDGGSLHSYLEKNDIKTRQQLKFCEECALGMEFLETNRVIHRDLAARNCLLTRDLQLKITDFGLSRQLETDENTYEMSCLKSIPVRWTAPEVFLNKKFTSKSDVWSYGVTTWEIFNRAQTPYGAYQDVQRIITNGKKLDCTYDIPPKIYEKLMDPCWNFNDHDRPNFTQILETIQKLMKEF